MSPFKRVVRPFTVAVSATEDKIIGPHKSLSDLVRIYYPGAQPVKFEGNFPFLSRDNKIRKYDPGITDRFVFSGWGSVKKFNQDAVSLIGTLNDQWKSMGFETEADEDRGVQVPNTTSLWDKVRTSKAVADNVQNNFQSVSFVMANADIMKKASIVRTVTAGWWAVSYRGKRSAKPALFTNALAAFEIAARQIIQSAKGRELYKALWREAGDPLDTNPGYPFFVANVNAEGHPVTRIKTVELFRDVARSAKTWKEVLTIVDTRAGGFGMRGFPFAVAPIRRQQPGNKWIPQFNITANGLYTAFDEKGLNTQRVAWMVPYVYNLLLTPYQTLLKTVRMLMPGLYHDGDAKTARLKVLSKAAQSKSCAIAEADYSNYDRFIPIDISEKIVSIFSKMTDRPNYWYDAAMYLHLDSSLVWPDFSNMHEGQGWLFKPGELGLMSGVKVTSEVGTFVNCIVNLAALMDRKAWKVDDAVSYLTQYLHNTPGSQWEYYYIQSDDTLLIEKDMSSLIKAGDTFMKYVNAAGLKGAIELGDRFLMRHMFAGRDTPVPARVWQNSLSNESPPENGLVCAAGLAARTDGLYGIKTVDAFGTGKRLPCSQEELDFTDRMLRSLREFYTTSRSRAPYASDLLDALVNTGKEVRAGGSVSTSRIDGLRTRVTLALAEFERSKLEGSRTSLESYLYSLFKDRFKPASGMLLEELLALDPSLNKAVTGFNSREHSFFVYAADTIGIKPLFS